MDPSQVLEDVASWTLTEDGWLRVDETLLRLDRAVEANDAELIRQTLNALVLSGPSRAKKRVDNTMDQPSLRPASAQTRDLTNRLLPRLGRPPQADPAPLPPAEGHDATS